MNNLDFYHLGLFSLGYQKGTIDYAKNPSKVEKQIIAKILAFENEDEGLHSQRSKLYRRIDAILQRILSSAKEYCKNELEAAISHSALATSSTSKNVQESKEEIPEIQKWKDSLERIERVWSLLICRKSDVNAFVSGTLPGKVFIYQGLIDKLEPTDDELATILGHEISHVILGHTEDQAYVSAGIIVGEMILLATIDPTGLSSFIFDSLIHKLGSIVDATYSRQQETDADELGIKIALLACYDVTKGISIFEKMANLKQDPNGSTSWTDTHPHPHERHQALLQLNSSIFEKQKVKYGSKSDYKELYMRDCHQRRYDFRRAVLHFLHLDTNSSSK